MTYLIEINTVTCLVITERKQNHNQNTTKAHEVIETKQRIIIFRIKKSVSNDARYHRFRNLLDARCLRFSTDVVVYKVIHK